jgi:hypothetical protein
MQTEYHGQPQSDFSNIGHDVAASWAQYKSANKTECFVIMPFSETTPEHTEGYSTKHFEDFLKPLIEQSPGVAAHKSAALRADLVTQIITDLVKSEIVVADLTDKNPNVLWELGVRQSFKSGTVTIAEKGTILPFDVYSKSTHFYDLNDRELMEDFRVDFSKALQDCLDNPRGCDSRVLEVIGGRGTLFEIVRREEIVRRLDAVIMEIDLDIGMLNTLTTVARRNLDQKNANVIDVLTVRFSLSAVESLLVDRYIEGDLSFFELGASCLRLAGAFNEQMNSWQYSPDRRHEKWLLNNAGSLQERLSSFRGMVVDARQKVLARY